MHFLYTLNTLTMRHLCKAKVVKSLENIRSALLGDGVCRAKAKFSILIFHNNCKIHCYDFKICLNSFQTLYNCIKVLTRAIQINDFIFFLNGFNAPPKSKACLA